MRYALLLSYDESAPHLSEEETLAAMETFFERAGTRLVSVLRLRPTSAATSIRVRQGDLVIADGPFAETKEQIGGVLVVDCADLDEAIELARDVPVARIGTVEVRPIWDA